MDDDSDYKVAVGEFHFNIKNNNFLQDETDKFGWPPSYLGIVVR